MTRDSLTELIALFWSSQHKGLWRGLLEPPSSATGPLACKKKYQPSQDSHVRQGGKRCDHKLPVAEVRLFFSGWHSECYSTALLNGVNMGGEPLESHVTTSSMFPNCWSMTVFSLSSAKHEKSYRHVVSFSMQ